MKNGAALLKNRRRIPPGNFAGIMQLIALKGNIMKAIGQLVGGLIIFFVVMALLKPSTQVTTTMTADQNGATLVTTDGYGNKQVCTTTVVSGTYTTKCN
jgi:hypothetical protein